MLNPYEGVDWTNTEYLHSVNHEHTFAPNTGGETWREGERGWEPQEVFDSLYYHGIRHFAISNYHPSKPTYPLADFFEEVPVDVIGCPNAEHTGTRGHYCAVGSTFESASRGFQGDWQDLFDGLLEELSYDGGGGIIINHPRRSGFSFEDLTDRFTYDDRIIGIEAWNHRGVVLPKYRSRGNALSTWDELLSAGVDCFGFFNPDYHTRWDWTRAGHPPRGRNVLLVEEQSESAAALAYREGRCFGALDGSGLRFEHIDASNGQVKVETDREAYISWISCGQVIASTMGTSAKYELTGGEPYIRIEAADETGERIFSQPIRFPEHDWQDE